MANKNDRREIEDLVLTTFKFVKDLPIIFTSALENKNINKIIDEVIEIKKRMDFDIKTSVVNEIFSDIQLMRPPSSFNGGRVTIKYVVYKKAENGKPPTFILNINKKKWMHFTYLRYIENQLRRKLDLRGLFIDLVLKQKEYNPWKK